MPQFPYFTPDAQAHARRAAVNSASYPPSPRLWDLTALSTPHIVSFWRADHNCDVFYVARRRGIGPGHQDYEQMAGPFDTEDGAQVALLLIQSQSPEETK